MRSFGLVLATFLFAACASSSSPTADAPAGATSASTSGGAAATSASTSGGAAATSAVPPASVTATPARLVSVITARDLDAAGKPIGTTDVFDLASDRRIVLAIAIAGATTATTIGYRRYFEGQFVDGKNTHPTHDGDGTVTFTWQKTAATYPAGTYLVRVLIDGKPVRSHTFVVR